MSRYADRLEATRLEHNRRRTDQIERHTIHVVPHIDALLTVAEPAFGAQVSWKAGRDERTAFALFVPRTRRWYLRGTGGGERCDVTVQKQQVEHLRVAPRE